MLEHVIEVIALHDHVVEFEEGQALLHPLFIALGAQHVVDGEASAHIAQQLHIIQVQQPVGVVQHQSLTVGEVDEFFHLLLEACRVVSNVFLGQHLAHVGAAGGVADHGGAAADQSDGTVACLLQAFHQGQGHKVASGQAVGRAVKADVERSLAVVDYLFDFFFVRNLCDQAAGFQFVVNRHGIYLPFVAARAKIKAPAKCEIWQRAKVRGTTSVCLPLAAASLRGCGRQRAAYTQTL